MNPSSMGMMGGMGGMNPMMMNPMMGMGDGMSMFGQGMPGMGMGGMGMGGMGGMGGGMGMGMGPGAAGPMGGGPGPAGPMGGDMGPDGKFYKTKICHKFMEGKCNYGPTCKYAHGEVDLRTPGGGGPAAPRQTGSGKVMTPHGPAAGMAGPGMGGMGPAMGGMGPAMGGAMGGGMGGVPKPPSGGAEKSQHWRTRLCDQFMREGTCRYGANCTFAHGHEQLRNTPGGQKAGGGARPNQQAGAQKRPLDQGGAGGDSMKRARTEPVVPPDHEALPVEGVSPDLAKLKARFQELIQEANRFARDTGHSVAVFTVGGIFSTEEDTQDLTSDQYLQDVKGKDNQPVQPNLKVAVLKYGTGGVSRQLTTRAEIVKFVSARGSKSIAEMHANAQQQANSA